MSDDWAIETNAVTKAYGSVPVLSGIDLRVRRGTVFSLLGPNGAGKTTTVRILATLIDPDGGSARVCGADVVRERHKVRGRISLTGQYAAVDDVQTGEENLRMMGRLAGLRPSTARRRAQELLAEFELQEAGKRRVGTYSGGMRRRLDLAASLVGHPSVIFLDEPTTGLDPRSRQMMWQVIRRLVDSGVTVFLTTQYLEEADQLADRIAVMDGGSIVAEGSAGELKNQFAEQRLDLVLSDPGSFQDISHRFDGRIVLRDPSRSVVGLPTDGTAAHVRSLLDEIDPSRRSVSSFALHTATLDDVFLALTGHLAEPAAKETADV